MIKRVVIVYNPRSSKADWVREEVIAVAQKTPGLMVGRYGVLKTNVDDNAMRLAKVLQDGDTIIAAGGDATATIALNGAMLSGKDVAFGALSYGNFNDMAGALAGYEGKTWYPLDIWIDGKHWRYAGCYFSVGMFAESTEIFNKKEERAKLRARKGGIVYSIWQLKKWYFQHKQESFLPEMKLNGRKLPGKTSDYLAVNGARVARVMKGDKYGLLKRTFWSGTGSLTSFWRLMHFMRKSMLQHIPGGRTKNDKLEFLGDYAIKIQAEGESIEVSGAKVVEVKKSEKGVRITKKLW